MATRLEPFRDYSEHEVVNLFSLDVPTDQNLSLWKAGTSGVYDAGVVVAAKAAVLPGDLPSPDALKIAGNLRNYLGASGQPHVGYNAYPVVEMTVEPEASDTDKAIGLTLKQTLAYDENDENLLRYPLKKDELQAVLPGQAVPILTRGLVLLNSSAFSVEPGVGDKLMVSDVAGQLVTSDGSKTVVGSVLAVNDSDGQGDATKFLCKVSF